MRSSRGIPHGISNANHTHILLYYEKKNKNLDETNYSLKNRAGS